MVEITGQNTFNFQWELGNLPESDDMFSAGNGIDINNGIIQNTGDLNPGR
ncbi:MAG: hypothetical protein R2769_07835 [Saprospiraceae bacterium]